MIASTIEEELVNAREEAMRQVRTNWDVRYIEGHSAELAKLQTWQAYTAAFAALDSFREKELKR